MSGAVLFLAMVLVCDSALGANELRGVLNNNAGVKQFEAQRADKAMDEFTRALSDLPFSGEVHLNVGNAFLARRDLDKALSEYRQAIAAAKTDSRRDRHTRFFAFFNSAIAQTELKRNDEALDLYQKALELDPNSLETKTNMELLTQQSSGDGEGENKDDQQQGGKDGDKKEDKDQKGDQKKDPKQQPDKASNPRATPRPFKSGELSKEDAKNILEEMKRQEEQIRARMQNEKVRERPPEKDW